jgi:3-oxoacyl-[acyl-carrier protein] reductase
MSSAESIREAIAATVALNGHIDILVNNAGRFVIRPLEETDAALFDELFRTNVLGPLLAIRNCLPHFPPKGGRIINIVSTLAATPGPGNALYAATKAALRALTQGYVQELGKRRITINAVGPGVLLTDMMAHVPQSAFDRLKSETAAGRVGTPEDIAPIVAFLASDDSEWMTGRTLYADGGRMIA